MKARLLIGAMMVSVAAVGVLTWWLTASVSAAQERSVRAERRAREVEASVAANRRRVAAAETKREELRTKLRDEAAKTASPPASVVAPAPASSSTGAPTINEAIKRWQEEQKRPEAQVKHLAARRERLPDTFGPFYRQLKLTADDIRAFEDIFMRNEEQVGDLMEVARAQGLSLRDKAVAKLWNEIYAETQRQQRELLGEAGFQELKTYERTTGVRDLVRNLTAMATVFGEPLSGQQIQQLIPILADTVETYRKGHFASTTAIDWDVALPAMAGVLSPRQLEWIKTFEPDGGGMFHARWNGELVRATRPETLTLPKKIGRARNRVAV